MINKDRETKKRLITLASLIIPGAGHIATHRIKLGLMIFGLEVLQVGIFVIGALRGQLSWVRGDIETLIATWLSVLLIVSIWALSYFSIRKNLEADETEGLSYWNRAIRDFLRDNKGLIGAFIILIGLECAFFAPLISPFQPLKMNLINTITPPGEANHLLGTDHYGRDILSRIIYGSRVALGIGAGATLFNIAFGGLLGLIGGYFKGIVDSIIMRLLEILNSIPYIIFALLVLSVFGSGIFQIIIVLGIYGLQAARIIRSEVLSVREEDYIMASEALGAGTLRKIFRHIFPNSMASLLVVTTMRIGGNIVFVAGLSFLGFGVKPPTPSWGAMLQEAQSFMTVAWWMAVFPGLAIVLTVFGFNIMGDSLRDVLDPKTASQT